MLSRNQVSEMKEIIYTTSTSKGNSTTVTQTLNVTPINKFIQYYRVHDNIYGTPFIIISTRWCKSIKIIFSHLHYG